MSRPIKPIIKTPLSQHALDQKKAELVRLTQLRKEVMERCGYW